MMCLHSCACVVSYTVSVKMWQSSLVVLKLHCQDHVNSQNIQCSPRTALGLIVKKWKYNCEWTLAMATGEFDKMLNYPVNSTKHAKMNGFPFHTSLNLSCFQSPNANVCSSVYKTVLCSHSLSARLENADGACLIRQRQSTLTMSS